MSGAELLEPDRGREPGRPGADDHDVELHRLAGGQFSVLGLGADRPSAHIGRAELIFDHRPVGLGRIRAVGVTIIHRLRAHDPCAGDVCIVHAEQQCAHARDDRAISVGPNVLAPCLPPGELAARGILDIDGVRRSARKNAEIMREVEGWNPFAARAASTAIRTLLSGEKPCWVRAVS